MSDVVESVNKKWNERFPNIQPRAEDMKSIFKARWIRLYILPGDKRWPDNPEEMQIALSRYNTILSELNSGEEIYVITTAWDGNSKPTAELQDSSPEKPRREYWRSFSEDPDETDPEMITYAHLYVQKIAWQDGCLNELLSRVADGQTAGVIIMPINMEWMFHPYDGGMDVIARTEEDAKQLSQKYKAWTA